MDYLKYCKTSILLAKFTIPVYMLTVIGTHIIVVCTINALKKQRDGACASLTYQSG